MIAGRGCRAISADLCRQGRDQLMADTAPYRTFGAFEGRISGHGQLPGWIAVLARDEAVCQGGRIGNPAILRAT